LTVVGEGNKLVLVWGMSQIQWQLNIFWWVGWCSMEAGSGYVVGNGWNGRRGWLIHGILFAVGFN